MKARIKPAGWGFGEKLTSAQASAADAYWPDVIDGAGGGTWAPTDPIIIGGDGLAVTGPFSANNANITGGVSVIGTTTLAVTEFTDTVTVDVALVIGSGASIDVDSGSIILSGAGLAVGTGVPSAFGGSVDFNAAVIAADNLTVLGSTSLNTATAASVVVGSAITMDATTLSTASGVTATFAGPASFTNSVGFTGIVTPSGPGRVRDKSVVLPDADHTLEIGEATHYFAPALGADRTYNLSNTGAGLGDKIRINAISNTTANSAVVTYGSQTWFLRNQTGQVVIIEFECDGSVWRVNDLVMWDGLLNG